MPTAVPTHLRLALAGAVLLGCDVTGVRDRIAEEPPGAHASETTAAAVDVAKASGSTPAGPKAPTPSILRAPDGPCPDAYDLLDAHCVHRALPGDVTDKQKHVADYARGVAPPPLAQQPQATEPEPAADRARSPRPETALAPGVQPYTYPLGGQTHQGAVFVPEGAAPPAGRPLMLLFSPTGDADGAVRRWQRAAQQHGWVVASSGHVKNGTADDHDAREYLALLDAVAADVVLDHKAIYGAGFSGGGCGAYLLALSYPSKLAGAIVTGGHMGPWRSLKRAPRGDQSFYLFAARSDFNHKHTQELAAAMKGSGYRVMTATGTGGHRAMTSNEQGEALHWMAGPLNQPLRDH